MTYVKECPKCHRTFEAESSRVKVCPDCKRAVDSPLCTGGGKRTVMRSTRRPGSG